jgi:aspartate/methionine/tyrosine aminotransferase
MVAKEPCPQFHIDPTKHFSYGNGPQGSPTLRKALAAFFNSHFNPLERTTSEEFVVTTGVTALIDHVSWCICANGEAILFPQPLYAGFTNDLPHRARGKLVPVPFEREDGSLDLNDVFDPEFNTRYFERAYRKCEREGVKVRGVMITK